MIVNWILARWNHIADFYPIPDVAFKHIKRKLCQFWRNQRQRKYHHHESVTKWLSWIEYSASEIVRLGEQAAKQPS